MICRKCESRHPKDQPCKQVVTSCDHDDFLEGYLSGFVTSDLIEAATETCTNALESCVDYGGDFSSCGDW